MRIFMFFITLSRLFYHKNLITILIDLDITPIHLIILQVLLGFDTPSL